MRILLLLFAVSALFVAVSALEPARTRGQCVYTEKTADRRTLLAGWMRSASVHNK